MINFKTIELALTALVMSLENFFVKSSIYNLHINWFGLEGEVWVSVGHQQDAGKEEEGEEPDGGGVADESLGDGDVEDAPDSSLLVVQLEGEGSGVNLADALYLQWGHVAVALTVRPEMIFCSMDRCRTHGRMGRMLTDGALLSKWKWVFRYIMIASEKQVVQMYVNARLPLAGGLIKQTSTAAD